MIEPKDVLNQPLAVGDYIAWASTQLRSAKIVVGKIIRFNWKRRSRYGSAEKCSEQDANLYTITLEPCFGGSSGWGSYDFPKKEVPDPHFVKFVWWDNGKRCDPPKVTYPGIKKVFDPDGKQPTTTIQRVDNVLKVDATAIEASVADAILKDAMRDGREARR